MDDLGADLVVGDIVNVIAQAAIAGAPYPSTAVEAIIAGLDTDGRTRVEEKVAELLDGIDPQQGADFRRVVDQGFRETMGLD